MRDAIALIADAVPARPGTWADLGAGSGTFTRALAARLGPDGRIYAVDRDPRAVRALARWAAGRTPTVVAVQGDVTRPFTLPGPAAVALDGILLANTLHFVPDQRAVLAAAAQRLRPGGRVVLVEYDRRGPSRWVPYPISPARFAVLAQSAGLAPPAITATRPSAFGGVLYVAAADRPAAAA